MSTSRARRLNRQINFSVGESEAATIDRAARIAGTSRAALARRHVLSAMGIPDSVNPKRYRSLASPDLKAVATLVAELGRVSGATIQLAKNLRQSGQPTLHAQAELVLIDLRRTSALATQLIEHLGANR